MVSFEHVNSHWVDIVISKQLHIKTTKLTVKDVSDNKRFIVNEPCTFFRTEENSVFICLSRFFVVEDNVMNTTEGLVTR